MRIVPMSSPGMSSFLLVSSYVYAFWMLCSAFRGCPGTLSLEPETMRHATSELTSKAPLSQPSLLILKRKGAPMCNMLRTKSSLSRTGENR
jgi:hypothetical protein